MDTTVFVYIWEYKVKGEHLEEFKGAYGPAGDWVQMFRRGKGFMATELHQDITDPLRFLTVDYWNSKEDRDNFQNQFSKEFEELDERCENFTEQEKLIGDFNSFTNRISK